MDALSLSGGVGNEHNGCLAQYVYRVVVGKLFYCILERHQGSTVCNKTFSLYSMLPTFRASKAEPAIISIHNPRIFSKTPSPSVHSHQNLHISNLFALPNSQQLVHKPIISPPPCCRATKTFPCRKLKRTCLRYHTAVGGRRIYPPQLNHFGHNFFFSSLETCRARWQREKPCSRGERWLDLLVLISQFSEAHIHTQRERVCV